MKKIENLRVAQIDEYTADQTCGPYYYLVTQTSTAFTAFRTRYGFMRWLNLRGLKLTEPLVETGEVASQKIQGHYYEKMMTPKDFTAFDWPAQHSDCYVLKNANYLPSVAYRNEEDGAVVLAYPWSGIHGEGIYADYWSGLAIEEGVAYKNHTKTSKWSLGSPEEIVAALKLVPEDYLSEVERALVASALVSLNESNPDSEFLNSSIVREMTFS